MTKRNYYPILPIIAGFALTACVTINIYFPAAAAEKVADKIIEEVWQTGGKPGGNTQSGGKPGDDAGNKTDKAKP
ncbi:MAG: hypothetical protein IT526_03795 [Nitrosomonas sp.]|uniref:hypothetical protein n=1 Tax=Nitrosomonas sp. TaxID=42353 RepID=UPI00256E3D24|nr:hypothetical protein [Nitrosomonas sp.]MCC6161355.1 hypothetical protein [Nitrosomonas sp.]MDL1866569.1 hypothetical protein [Betaproteobacteria bacterium PRO4]